MAITATALAAPAANHTQPCGEGRRELSVRRSATWTAMALPPGLTSPTLTLNASGEPYLFREFGFSGLLKRAYRLPNRTAWPFRYETVRESPFARRPLARLHQVRFVGG